MHWCKLFKDFFHNPKIQMLTFTEQRHFIALMTLHINGQIYDLTLDQIRTFFAVKRSTFAKLCSTFVRHKLTNSQLHIIKWEESQLSESPAAMRKRAYRESKKNANEEWDKNGTCPTLEVELEVEIDKDKEREIITAAVTNNLTTPNVVEEDAAAAFKNYFDEFEKWFPPQKFLPYRNPQVVTMLKRWHEHGVTAEDVAKAISDKRQIMPQIVSPLYFNEIAIDYAESRKLGYDGVASKKELTYMRTLNQEMPFEEFMRLKAEDMNHA